MYHAVPCGGIKEEIMSIVRMGRELLKYSIVGAMGATGFDACDKLSTTEAAIHKAGQTPGISGLYQTHAPLGFGAIIAIFLTFVVGRIFKRPEPLAIPVLEIVEVGEEIAPMIEPRVGADIEPAKALPIHLN